MDHTTRMTNIEMSLDDTLELDTIIEEWNPNSSLVDDVGGNFNISGFQTSTTVLDPQNTGTHKININDQELTVKVTDTSTIPDTQNLQARYDWTQEDGSTPITDQTGNGYDLSGQYSGVGRSINNNQAGEFDGANDSLSQSSQIANTPVSVYIVFLEDTIPSKGFTGFVDSSDEATGKCLIGGRTSPDDTSIVNGSFIDMELRDTATPHIAGGAFDGDNSVGMYDGSEFTGDTGSRTPDGLTVGNQGADSGDYLDGLIGEILYYGVKHDASTRTDVQNYLSDKWGVAI